MIYKVYSNCHHCSSYEYVDCYYCGRRTASAAYPDLPGCRRPSAKAVMMAIGTLPYNDLLYGDTTKSVSSDEMAKALQAAYDVDFAQNGEDMKGEPVARPSWMWEKSFPVKCSAQEILAKQKEEAPVEPSKEPEEPEYIPAKNNGKWEYRKVASNNQDDIKELNKLGREGWEVISVHHRTSYSRTFYLMRAVQENPLWPGAKRPRHSTGESA